jgi:hypothetical protein
MPKNTKEYQRDYRQRRKDAPKAAQIEREMQAQYAKAKQRLETALKTCMPGSNSYLKYTEAISDLERRYREERAERGLDPESLGTAARQGWHFVCHVSTQGTASVMEVPADRVEELLAQRAKTDAARLTKMTGPGENEIRAQLDAEFGFVTGAEKSEETHD